VAGGHQTGIDAASGEGFHLAGGVPHQKDVVGVAARREVQGDGAPIHAGHLNVPEQVREGIHQAPVAPDRLVRAVTADARAHPAIAGGDDPAEPAWGELSSHEDVDEVLPRHPQAALDAQAVDPLAGPGEPQAAGHPGVSAVGSHHQASGELEVAAVALAVEADAAVLSLGVHHAGPQQVGARGLGLLAEQLVEAHPVYRQGAGVAATDGQLAAAGGVDVSPGQPVRHYRLAHVRLLHGARADQPGAVGRHADTPVLLQERDPKASRGQIAGAAASGRAGSYHGDVMVIPYRVASSSRAGAASQAARRARG